MDAAFRQSLLSLTHLFAPALTLTQSVDTVIDHATSLLLSVTAHGGDTGPRTIARTLPDDGTHNGSSAGTRTGIAGMGGELPPPPPTRSPTATAALIGGDGGAVGNSVPLTAAAGTVTAPALPSSSSRVATPLTADADVVGASAGATAGRTRTGADDAAANSSHLHGRAMGGVTGDGASSRPPVSVSGVVLSNSVDVVCPVSSSRARTTVSRAGVFTTVCVHRALCNLVDRVVGERAGSGSAPPHAASAVEGGQLSGGGSSTSSSSTSGSAGGIDRDSGVGVWLPSTLWDAVCTVVTAIQGCVLVTATLGPACRAVHLVPPTAVARSGGCVDVRLRLTCVDAVLKAKDGCRAAFGGADPSLVARDGHAGVQRSASDALRVRAGWA